MKRPQSNCAPSHPLRLVAVTAVLSGVVGLAVGADLGKLLKGGAIAVVVDKFGPDINRGINRITGDKNLGGEQATKVVPILSLGNGQAVGAVQVTGPEEKLQEVKAVAQLDGKVNLVGGIRLKALIPIASRSVSNIKRIPGVGVSALVDIKL